MAANELSHRYAMAVFDLALEKWVATLKAVQGGLKSDPTKMSTLQNAGTAFEQKKQVIDSMLPRGTETHLTNFFYTLVKEGHIDSLPGIVAEIERLARGGLQLQVAQVTSAVALTEAEKDQFRTRLREKYGANLEFDFQVDSALVGGVVVQVGDEIIDGSVASRLAAMSNRLGVSY